MTADAAVHDGAAASAQLCLADREHLAAPWAAAALDARRAGLAQLGLHLALGLALEGPGVLRVVPRLEVTQRDAEAAGEAVALHSTPYALDGGAEFAVRASRANRRLAPRRTARHVVRELLQKRVILPPTSS